MADVNINIFTNKIYKQGASTVVPGFIQGEEPTPINPSGSGGASELVPYDGALRNVNLGEFGMSAGFFKLDTTPTNTPTDQGTFYWDEDDNTVDIILNGYIMKVGEDLFYPVKNQTGSSIPKGTNVRFAGTVGGSGRLLIEPYLADGTFATSRYMGVTAETIGNGEDGKVLWFGRIRGINTNVFNEGDILYASTTSAGGFQTTLPVAPNNVVEVCAVVTKSVNQGVIFVRPQFLWGGTIGGSIASGEVAFGTGTNTIGGDNGLFWDNTNKRLGIGTNAPDVPLKVVTNLNVNPIITEGYSNLATTASILLNRRGRGTSASPLAVQNGDVLGGIFATGYNGTGFTQTNSAAIMIFASENYTPSAQGSDIVFQNTANGSITRTVKLRLFNNGNILIQNGGTFTNAGFRLDVNGTVRIQDNLTLSDAKNLILGTTTGTKIGTATSEKLSFWNATPIVQPTTGIAESAFVENAGGTAVNDDSTFDGYTLRQVVKALRDAGLLA